MKKKVELKKMKEEMYIPENERTVYSVYRCFVVKEVTISEEAEERM
jgi:hypothetical protein